MDEVIIGRDKRDPSLIIAYLKDESYPLVYCRLEFLDDKENFIPVMSFCPVINDARDFDIQRKISDKLKKLILDSISDFKVKIRLDPDGDLAVMANLLDGRRSLIPVAKLEEIRNNKIIIESNDEKK